MKKLYLINSLIYKPAVFLFLGIFFGLFSPFAVKAQLATQLADGTNGNKMMYDKTKNLVTIRSTADECAQITNGNDVENGLGNLNVLTYANDLVVNAGEDFALETISFRVLIQPETNFQNANISFYEDSGNGPGAEILSFSSVAPTSSQAVGEAFGFELREVVFELAESVSLPGSGVPSVYWVGIVAQTTSEAAYMEVTSILNTPNEIYFFDPDDEVWISSGDENNGFGEFYDGVISFFGDCSAQDACNGQPAAGEVSPVSLTVCPGIGFQLSTSGYELQGGGIIAKWQKRDPMAPEAIWEDISGANTTVLNMANGIEAPTEFRFYVQCMVSELIDATEPVLVSLSPANECYCTPDYALGCMFGTQINNVKLNGESVVLDNSSECSEDGYGDYRAENAPDLAPGNTYSLIITTDNADAPIDKDIIAWIDFNQDGFFDSDEVILNTEGMGMTNQMQSFPIIIPQDAEPGLYTMRIRLAWSESEIDPCDEIFFGEAEDYTIEIIELINCEGQPTAGTVSGTNEVCSGTQFILSASGSTFAAAGLDRVWQSSPAGENEWTDITGAISTSYSSEGILAPTDYRFVVTCQISGLSDISDVFSVGLKPVTECYCTPQYDFGCEDYGDQITKVVLNGMTVNLNNISTCSPGGYGDFTNLPAPDMAPGYAYSILVGTDSGDAIDEEVRVWIDYNNNGVFDNDEIIADTDGMGLGSSQTFSFTIPAGVDLGLYRMRVRLGYGEEGMDACEQITWGEAEDYTVEIAEPTGLIDYESLDGFSFYPNPTKNTIYLESQKLLDLVEIFDLSGRRVLAPVKDSNAKNISVAELSSGIYLMKVTIGNNSATYKFVKM